jgi:hypothetical protein
MIDEHWELGGGRQHGCELEKYISGVKRVSGEIDPF